MLLLVFLALLAFFLASLYRNYYPATAGIFPLCPVRAFSGFKCPFCGLQTALHHLLNLRPAAAARENLLGLLLFPYLLAIGSLALLKNHYTSLAEWQGRLLHNKVLVLLASCALCWGVLRNVISL